MITRTSCSIFAATGHKFIHLPPSFRSNIPLYSTSFIAAKQLLNQQQYRLQSTDLQKVQRIKSKINPPESTLPAPLDIPPREPNQNLFKWLLKSGKLYLGFYKTGIKNIWANYKNVKPLRARFNSTQTPQLPPSRGKDGKTTHQNLYAKFALTRAEFQFLMRSRSDVSRVPVFALLFAVLGEWLPLVVIFVTPIVPYPCRIPKQIRQTREGLEKRRHDSFRGITDGYVPNSKVMRGEGEVKDLKQLNKGQLMHISRSLGLHFGVWDRISYGHFPPEMLLRYKVEKWLKYLDQDDALLKRDGGIEELKGEELKLAAEQRGIDILGRKDDELRKNLQLWMKGRSEGKVLSMLLTRPSVWKS